MNAEIKAYLVGRGEKWLELFKGSRLVNVGFLMQYLEINAFVVRRIKEMTRRTNIHRILPIIIAFIMIVSGLLLFPEKSYAASSGTWGSCAWILDGGVLTISPEDSVSGELDPALYSSAYYDSYYTPWRGSSVYSIKFEGTVFFPSDSNHLFAGCKNVETIDLTGTDISNVTDMSALFSDCQSLKNIDVSGWDTSNVTNMSAMFFGCQSLKNIDVSGWDTSNVTNMSAMFSGCKSLKNIDVSDWDTSKVTNMAGMFHDCISLIKLDVSDWDTGNVTDMSAMFFTLDYNGMSLRKLDVSNWNTSKVTTLNSLFSDCRLLQELDVSGWDTSNVTNMTAVFYHCDSLTELDVAEWDTSKVTSMSDLFCGCGSLMSLDVSDWNTSNVTDMSGVFVGCSSLPNIDVNDWDTSNVTSMALMFGSCSLTLFEVSDWDMSKVESIGGMFDGCSSLTSLDVSSWDTSSLTVMTSAFRDCGSLIALDVSNWNTSNITEMAECFSGCHSLRELDVSGWDTSNVTSTQFMFGDCKSLASLDVSGWDTRKMSDMSLMFLGCNSLTDLNVSGWDTSNVTNIGGMFADCKSLISLDLSNWNTDNMTEIVGAIHDAISHSYHYYGLFDGCSSLRKLVFPDCYYEVSLPKTMMKESTGDFVNSCTSADTYFSFVNVYYRANNEQETTTDCQCIPWVDSATYYSLKSNSIDVSGNAFICWNTSSDGSGHAFTDGQLVTYDEIVGFAQSGESDGIVNLYAIWKTKGMTRIYGANRFATAIAAANHFKVKNNIDKFDNIIVASGIGFPDALSASYLAYVKTGPILLVSDSTVSMVTNYINANLAPDGTVFIVGGTGAVTDEVDKKINGSVKRLAGSDRYDTNLKVLKEAGFVFDEFENVLVACGTNFADALSASAIGEPILLVGKQLTPDQTEYLSSFAPRGNEETVQSFLFSIIGGPGAVPDEVANQLKQIGAVERVYGNDRFATSIAVADHFFPETTDAVIIANGNNFPDGLSGGPIATTYDAPLILVLDKVYTHAADYFTQSQAFHLVIMGGTGVIADNTAEKIIGGTV